MFDILISSHSLCSTCSMKHCWTTMKLLIKYAPMPQEQRLQFRYGPLQGQTIFKRAMEFFIVTSRLQTSCQMEILWHKVLAIGLDSCQTDYWPFLFYMVQNKINSREVKHLVAPYLRGGIPKANFNLFVKIAQKCVYTNLSEWRTLAGVITHHTTSNSALNPTLTHLTLWGPGPDPTIMLLLNPTRTLPLPKPYLNPFS